MADLKSFPVDQQLIIIMAFGIDSLTNKVAELSGYSKDNVRNILAKDNSKLLSGLSKDDCQKILDSIYTKYRDSIAEAIAEAEANSN